MTIFFETYSVLQTLMLVHRIREADVIYFHDRAFPKINHNPVAEKVVTFLIRLINRKAKIGLVPLEMVLEHNWEANRRSIEIVENLSAEIEASPSYRIILGFLKDPNLAKCYKTYLVNLASKHGLFTRLADDLVRKDSHCLIVPADSFRSFARWMLAITVFLFMPIVFLATHIRYLSFKKIARGKKYDVAIPIVYGFRPSDQAPGPQKRNNDYLLYGNELKPGRIIHVFSHWRESAAIEKEYIRIMDENGMAHVDSRLYKVTPHIIRQAFFFHWKAFLYLASFAWLRDKSDYTLFSGLIVRHILNNYLELENIDYKVAFMRTDYSQDHVIKTIVCNSRGIKTVAIQHSSFPYILPQLAYTHVDKYIVYGELFVKAFSPYWDGLALARTGRENIDLVADIVNDRKAVEAIRARMDTVTKKRRYTAVIAFPSSGRFNPKGKWDEMYKAFSSLRSMDLDCTIFFRFRAKDDPEKFEHIGRFRDLARLDDRIVIELDAFTTQELMTASDLVIANNVSYSIYESLAAEARVFTFDFMGAAKYFYRDYGRDLILKHANDIVRAFMGLKTGFEGFDCKWEELKRDSNYYYDGRNKERIRRSVWETVIGETDDIAKGEGYEGNKARPHEGSYIRSGVV